MIKHFKRTAAILTAAVMALSLFSIPIPVLGANTAFQSDFNTSEEQTKTFTVANGETFPVTYERGMGGKNYDDYSMKLTADKAEATSDTVNASFEVPYYNARWVNSAARTLEISMLYGGDADGAKLSCCMYTYEYGDRGHLAVYTIAEIKDGTVYVLDKDTGIRCQKDEWLHVAVEEHWENISMLKIYINGRLIDTGLAEGHMLCGNRWTQAMAYFNGSSTGRGYIALDDAAIYEGEYEAMAHGGYVSGDAELFVNESLSDSYLQKGDVLTARVNGFGKGGTQGALIMPIYDGDILVETLTDIKTYNGSTDFSVSYTVENPDSLNISAMFIESLQTMHPAGSGKKFIKGEPAGDYKIYCNNSLSSEEDMTFTVNANANSIEYLEEETDSGINGFMRITKTNDKSAYAYVETGRTAQNVVISGDIRVNSSSPRLRYVIGDGLSGTSNIYCGAFDIADCSVEGNSLSTGEWHKLCAALDLTAKKFDVFLDGKKIAAGKSISDSAFSYLTQFRFYCTEGTDRGSIDIDNIAVYEAAAPMDIGSREPVLFDRFAAVDSAEIYLKGKKAVQTYSNALYNGSEKKQLVHECINYGDESLLPKEAFEALFDKTVTVSENQITVSDGTVFNIASRIMTRPDGVQRGMQCAPEMHDGVVYLPAAAYGKIMCSSTFFNDDHGMFINGSGITKGDARLKAANLYMFFDRKPPEKLKSQLLVNSENFTKHPRLMITQEDVTRIKSERKTDPYIKEWYLSVKSRGDSMLSAEPYTYYLVDGSLRNTAVCAADRIETLSFLYLISGQSAYAKRAIKEMEAVLSFPDWTPNHFLETAALATGTAIGYDWLYNYLTEEQRKDFAEKIQQLSIKQARLAYEGKAPFNDFFWNTETNWGIIANGGIVNAVLATAEYNTDECMQTMYYALRAMEYTWYRFAPDGAWHEGPGYWSYMLGHLAKFLSCYRTAMGEGFAENYRGLDKYGYFQCCLMGPDGLPNNFHDADSENIQSEGQFLLAGIYGDKELMRYRRHQMEKHGIEPLVQDIIWYDTSISDDSTSVALDSVSYFRETELVSIRESWDSSESAWLSFHGGSLNGAHDHIDAGTFVYAIGGERWAIDLGKDTLRYAADNPATNAGYSVQDFYRARAEGHNCVVLNPDINPEMNLNSYSQVSEPVKRADSVFSTVNLSDAYSKNADSYIRGYRLTDNMRTLTVRDEISLKGSTNLYWFMHTEGSIEIINSSTAIITKNGKQLKIQISTNAPGCTLTAEKAESLPSSPQFEMTENTGVTKLTLHSGQASGNINITVKMSLVGETGSSTGVDTTSISNW